MSNEIPETFGFEGKSFDSRGWDEFLGSIVAEYDKAVLDNVSGVEAGKLRNELLNYVDLIEGTLGYLAANQAIEIIKRHLDRATIAAPESLYANPAFEPYFNALQGLKELFEKNQERLQKCARDKMSLISGFAERQIDEDFELDARDTLKMLESQSKDEKLTVFANGVDELLKVLKKEPELARRILLRLNKVYEEWINVWLARAIKGKKEEVPSIKGFENFVLRCRKVRAIIKKALKRLQ